MVDIEACDATGAPVLLVGGPGVVARDTHTIPAARSLEQAPAAEHANRDTLLYLKQHFGDKAHVYGDTLVVEHGGEWLTMPLTDKDRALFSDALAGGEASRRLDELMRTGTYKRPSVGVQDHEVYDEIVIEGGPCVLGLGNTYEEAVAQWSEQAGDADVIEPPRRPSQEKWLELLRLTASSDAHSYRTMMPLDGLALDMATRALGIEPIMDSPFLRMHPAGDGRPCEVLRIEQPRESSAYAPGSAEHALLMAGLGVQAGLLDAVGAPTRRSGGDTVRFPHQARLSRSVPQFEIKSVTTYGQAGALDRRAVALDCVSAHLRDSAERVLLAEEKRIANVLTAQVETRREPRDIKSMIEKLDEWRSVSGEVLDSAIARRRLDPAFGLMPDPALGHPFIEGEFTREPDDDGV